LADTAFLDFIMPDVFVVSGALCRNRQQHGTAQVDKAEFDRRPIACVHNGFFLEKNVVEKLLHGTTFRVGVVITPIGSISVV